MIQDRRPEPPGTPDLLPLTDRLRQAARPYSARRLAELTGYHPERVRRYLRGEAPCITFVLAVCGVLGLSADWLLFGRGPMLAAECTRQGVLLHATLPELLDALAWRWLRQPLPDGLADLRAALAGLNPLAPPSPGSLRSPPGRRPPPNGQRHAGR